MALIQRSTTLATIPLLFILLILYHILNSPSTPHFPLRHHPTHQNPSTISPTPKSLLGPIRSTFPPTTAPPPSQNHTLILIIPRTTTDNTTWLSTHLPTHPLALYTVDHPTTPSLTTPLNKGHEVMAYLTYIITHHSTLPSILIFMHAHRHTWHNNALLRHDAVQTIKRLNPARVLRLGYMNLRCAWDPGCPTWLHPFEAGDSLGKQEQGILAQSWHELFPLDAMPDGLAQPCCGQFAVSGERVRRVPVERWVFWRDWLLRTELTDYFSGRLWEFVWQFVLGAGEVSCVGEEECYCDGFGVCFEEGGWGVMEGLRGRREVVGRELEGLRKEREGGSGDGEEEGEGEREGELRAEVEVLDREIEMRLKVALGEEEEEKEE